MLQVTSRRVVLESGEYSVFGYWEEGDVGEVEVV